MAGRLERRNQASSQAVNHAAIGSDGEALAAPLDTAPGALADPAKEERSASLDAFAGRLRTLRAQRGLTRKALAESASVSDRYLASLEFGRANPSFLILEQLAQALQCSLAELVGDVTASSPEWLLIRDR